MSAAAHQPPKLHPLAGNQARAVHPAQTVWLSASAGTGKTQVLSSRVLRLLLQPDVAPEQILCLTFTKAGATEMAARINDVLARWVRADPVRLAQELEAIGADILPETQARARTLFAAVLDCPGGGLRIDTIHAFAQWLLAAFPNEAGLSAGARPMEETEKTLLARQVLADMLLAAEAAGPGDASFATIEALSLRMGAEAVEAWLMRCAAASSLWASSSDWAQGPLAGPVRRVLGLRHDASMADAAAMVSDDGFDIGSLRVVLETCQNWTDKKGAMTATAAKKANAIGDWLAMDAGGRLGGLEDLQKAIFTKDGVPSYLASLEKVRPDYADYCARVGEGIAAVAQLREQLALAQWLAPALELGRSFAQSWEAAKAREGLIDFDDQIARAAQLLSRSDMADWIRYKLDRRFDHILVDEAQDTNAAQWRIIEALTEEFFAGLGAHEDKARTLFVVGDYKQAIFGFQGTSPENFTAARERVRARMDVAASNEEAARAGLELPKLQELDLERSFRTAAPVLEFVDKAIAHVGPAAFGLAQLPERHVGERRPGHVALWAPVGGAREDDEDDAASADEEAESWLSGSERKMAQAIAAQVRHWMDTGFPLVKGARPGEPRRADAGDVMILVRKRRALAGLIVARLHAAGVPVAGVDRLRLSAPLAVRDVVAALRFGGQPLDDLNLASLLVSPLFGWTQQDLLDHGYRPERASLWGHLRASTAPQVVQAVAQLSDLLARADFEPVPALLQWLLAGPWEARAKLVGRLGEEANDPLDELVNAAMAYAAASVPSLAGFLAWFDAGVAGGGGGELKRETARSAGQVRVMTVHGSKGLQAPIVILADAASDPSKRKGSALSVADPHGKLSGEERMVPLPSLRKAARLGPVAAAAEAAAQAESEEYWRLLYVAMTRAEEALFIGGALGESEKAPAAASWYAKLAEMFGPQQWHEDPIWGARAELAPLPAMPQLGGGQALALPMDAALPGWVSRAAPDEPRPARPLVPSALGEDMTAASPLVAQGDASGEASSGGSSSLAARARAARRGTLIHRLLERLPALAAPVRPQAATAWLARHAADFAEAAREDMAQAALGVLDDARWADLFTPDALAEAPIAALVGDQVVQGTIDRLLITPGTIRLIDFKTTRRPPANADGVPAAILRQMAAYALALQAAYPGRVVEAGVLYTHAPCIISLPDSLLAPHKAALLPAQQSLGLE